ncbi:glycosyltransferase [Vibrio campbellii]|uniref:glycosyltransferase n=1 Tax=Vibrio campbellii TaxID=680 RepID=UPI001F26D0B0|nr:glycosyltransferase family 2 protein [Vibrio campbellii]MCE7729342.1 glycosyltransferase family 2 protein [Vibrio campbellii]
MTSLAIITYTRAQESLTQELIDIGNRLHQLDLDVTMEWYSEGASALPENIDFELKHNVVTGTKFRKLTHLLDNKKYDYLLSLDNDIEANFSGLLKLVEKTIAGNHDLSWGRVYSRNVNNVISSLVKVDKLLSHNILRPTLWKLNQGVTIPGQCFMMRLEAFKDQLPKTDTFLDDLSIGLFAAKNKLSYLYLPYAVVYETPSYSFIGLLKQRVRWAIGYKQSLSCKSLTRLDKRLLYIHGFVYHLLPLCHLSILMTLLVIKPVWFVLLLLSTAIFISYGNKKSVHYAIAYQLVFPVFHLRWLFEFLKR